MGFFNLGLRGKILSLSFSAIILCLAVSGFGFWKSNQTMQDYKYIAEVNVPNLSSLYNMEIVGVKIQAACNLLIGSNTSKDDAAKADKIIAEQTKEFAEYVKTYEALPFMDGEEALWKKFKEEFWVRYIESAKKIVSLSGTGQSVDRETRDHFAEETWSKLLEEKDAKFDELTSFQRTAVKANSELASKSSALLSWLIPLMFAIVFLVSSVIVFSFTTKVTNQIQEYVNQLSQSAQSVLSESGHLSSASTQLASTTSEQSSAVQETSASVEEIKAMAGKNSDLANSSSEEALSLHKNAEDGRRIAEDLVGSMREISDSNNKISEAVQTSNVGLEKIVSMINEIATKTQVINDIVFQTKLLSFNASVEAARAGEHGKGFAVVAEEVGNLATMSGNAAKEIGQLLENSVSQVQQIAKETSNSTSTLLEVSKEKLNTGEQAVKASSETFTEMATKLSGIAQLATQISQASQEQVSGIAQIATAMENLSTSTHEIASASESTSSTSQLLRSQSEDLKLIAENLNAIISGQNHSMGAISENRSANPYKGNLGPLMICKSLRPS